MHTRQRQRLVRITATTLVVVVLVAIVVGFVRFLKWEAPGRVMTGIYDRSVRVRLAAEAASRAYRGDDPVLAIQDENERLRTGIAQTTELREENAFLRLVSDLPARRERTVVDAGVFAYGIGGNAERMIMNRGGDDGVMPGATVTTETGIFLGLVESVHAKTATVRVVGDPAVQVTARVRGGSINGLVRLDAFGELVLDLIAKDELVTEGAIVETSGLDQMPAGLRIGTVRTVDADRTTLFQIIRLDAAHRSGPVTRVLVLNP